MLTDLLFRLLNKNRPCIGGAYAKFASHMLRFGDTLEIKNILLEQLICTIVLIIDILLMIKSGISPGLTNSRMARGRCDMRSSP